MEEEELEKSIVYSQHLQQYAFERTIGITEQHPLTVDLYGSLRRSL
jgi:hypothetical protein